MKLLALSFLLENENHSTYTMKLPELNKILILDKSEPTYSEIQPVKHYWLFEKTQCELLNSVCHITDVHHKEFLTQISKTRTTFYLKYFTVKICFPSFGELYLISCLSF